MPPHLPGHMLAVLADEFDRAMYQLVFWVEKPNTPGSVADELERIAKTIREGKAQWRL